MSYRYRDAEGDRIEIEGVARSDEPFLSIDAFERGGAWTTVHVPLDQVEALIAGIREQARMAAGN